MEEERVNEEGFSAWEWFLKGFDMLKVKKNKEALRCFEKALNIDPFFADALYHAAIASFRLGNYEASRIYNEKVRDIYGDDSKHVRSALVYRNLGMISWEEGNTGKALEYFKKGASIAENFFRESKGVYYGFLFLIGKIYYEDGRIEYALDNLLRAKTGYDNIIQVVLPLDYIALCEVLLRIYKEREDKVAYLNCAESMLNICERNVLVLKDYKDLVLGVKEYCESIGERLLVKKCDAAFEIYNLNYSRLKDNSEEAQENV